MPIKNTSLAIVALTLVTLSSCSPYKKFRVPTAGMEPAIVAEEEITADERAYANSPPRPGDVVVIELPSSKSTIIVKRCVAEGGQVVEIRAGVLYVNNAPFDTTVHLKRTNPAILPPDYRDPRISPSDAGNIDNYGPVTVPAGKFFVLGDNRDNSVDSRYFGFVDRAAVRGKALSISDSDDKSRVGIQIR